MHGLKLTICKNKRTSGQHRALNFMSLFYLRLIGLDFIDGLILELKGQEFQHSLLDKLSLYSTVGWREHERFPASSFCVKLTSQRPCTKKANIFRKKKFEANKFNLFKKSHRHVTTQSSKPIAVQLNSFIAV